MPRLVKDGDAQCVLAVEADLAAARRSRVMPRHRHVLHHPPILAPIQLAAIRAGAQLAAILAPMPWCGLKGESNVEPKRVTRANLLDLCQPASTHDLHMIRT